jgi:hypothetical protein
LFESINPSRPPADYLTCSPARSSGKRAAEKNSPLWYVPKAGQLHTPAQAKKAEQILTVQATAGDYALKTK